MIHGEIDEHHAELSRGMAIRPDTTSTTAVFPSDTAYQPRLQCAWMDGCKVRAPRRLRISEAQLISQITSSHGGARGSFSPLNPSLQKKKP